MFVQNTRVEPFISSAFTLCSTSLAFQRYHLWARNGIRLGSARRAYGYQFLPFTMICIVACQPNRTTWVVLRSTSASTRHYAAVSSRRRIFRRISTRSSTALMELSEPPTSSHKHSQTSWYMWVAYILVLRPTWLRRAVSGCWWSAGLFVGVGWAGLRSQL